jgi:glutaredoxin
MILRAFLAFAALVAMLAASGAGAQTVPFEIARLQKDFPVTLYSGPSCREACDDARGTLNKRSVPFTEVLVHDEETIAKLRSVSGSNQLPVLVVGREMQIGYEPGQYAALLDSAGYPPAGTYPARNQAAPKLDDAQAKPAAPKPAPGPKPGPYDTSGLKGPPPKPGIYDPSGLTGPAPKPGQYVIPGEAAK